MGTGNWPECTRHPPGLNNALNCSFFLTITPFCCAPYVFAAFTSLTLLGVLQVPLFQMPMLVSGLVAARVAMGRLQAILASEEQPPLGALPPAAPGEPLLLAPRLVLLGLP